MRGRRLPSSTFTLLTNDQVFTNRVVLRGNQGLRDRALERGNVRDSNEAVADRDSVEARAVDSDAACSDDSDPSAIGLADASPLRLATSRHDEKRERG